MALHRETPLETEGVLIREFRGYSSLRISYMGTSLIRKRLPLGPYSGAVPRSLWWS